MEKIISVSLGATICSKEGSFDLNEISSIADQLGSLASRGYFVVAVVGLGGAGIKQREFFSKYSKSKNSRDKLNIEISKLNAMLLISVLRAKSAPVFPEPLNSINELDSELAQCESKKSGAKIFVLGGLEPGLTSDASAAKISQKYGCNFLIVSTKGGIYDRNPDLSGAMKLRVFDRNMISRLFSKESSSSEPHVLDQKTLEILLRMRKPSTPKKRFTIAVTGYEHISEFPDMMEKHASSNTMENFTLIVI